MPERREWWQLRRMAKEKLLGDMSQLFVNVLGHNSSGKTTLSQKLQKSFDFNIVGGDDFRLFIYEHIPYFHSVNNSYPTDKNKELNPLVKNYRFELMWILLKAEQNVLLDGSGATKEIRSEYLRKMKTEFPGVKTVLIWVEIGEADLLKRLSKRDENSNARWTDMYFDFKKDFIKKPSAGEADKVLTYNQNNYLEIERELKNLAG